jgi:hypothetical protein
MSRACFLQGSTDFFLLSIMTFSGRKRISDYRWGAMMSLGLRVPTSVIGSFAYWSCLPQPSALRGQWIAAQPKVRSLGSYYGHLGELFLLQRIPYT